MRTFARAMLVIASFLVAFVAGAVAWDPMVSSFACWSKRGVWNDHHRVCECGVRGGRWDSGICKIPPDLHQPTQ